MKMSAVDKECFGVVQWSPMVHATILFLYTLKLHLGQVAGAVLCCAVSMHAMSSSVMLRWALLISFVKHYVWPWNCKELCYGQNSQHSDDMHDWCQSVQNSFPPACSTQ